ncbi:MAG TPA: OST-HTH/LOTUS domain-containing protein, partial [Longimicrobiaceae bacterium]|nr:OST-HTH/LOTUS domain-containing protein [Longimicrobiaceae bacterium]
RADEIQESKEDPWVLVKRAVQQMVKNGDVMRTDRLKQVILDLDPGFDEKKVGYSKFSRFVSEAASKGLIRLRKSENGQYEILPSDGEPESRDRVVERIVAEAEAASDGRRRRGRGREERPREERPVAPVVREEVGAVPTRADAPAVEAVEATKPVERGEAGAPRVQPATIEKVGEVLQVGDGIDGAYALLQEAVRRLSGSEGKAIRDGDVKRRMLEISRDFDETKLGFPKFTRFLRQAHDAEVIDLSRAAGGNYEVSLSPGGRRLPPPPAAAVEGGVEAPREVKTEAAADRRAAAAATTAATPQGVKGSGTITPAAPPAQPLAGALRGRRGGRPLSEGPPPMLPGQVIASPVRPGPAVTPPPAEEGVTAAAEAGGAVAEESRGRSRSRRGRRGRGREGAKAADEVVPPDAEPATPRARSHKAKAGPVKSRKAEAPARGAGRSGARSAEAESTAEPKVAATPRSRRGGRAAQSPEVETPAPSAPDIQDLPTAPAEIRSYLAGYRGVGEKTAEALVESFGERVFDALQTRAKEVRALLGDRRAKTVLDQWSADRDRRAPAESPAKAPAAEGEKPKRSSRGRRGGRKKEPAGTA